MISSEAVSLILSGAVKLMGNLHECLNYRLIKHAIHKAKHHSTPLSIRIKERLHGVPGHNSMHVGLFQVSALLCLIIDVKAQGPEVGELAIYAFQPIENHTYRSAEDLKLQLRIDNSPLALYLLSNPNINFSTLGFNLSYWIFHANDLSQATIVGPLTTRVSAKSKQFNITDATF